MTRLLRDLFARPGAARTVILLGPDAAGAPRQYEVRPGRALAAVALAAVVALAVVAAVALAPLRGLGGGADGLRSAAEANAARAAALEDSLALQAEHVAQLRALITGGPTPGPPPAPGAVGREAPRGDAPPEGPADGPAEAVGDHGQPALPLRALGPAAPARPGDRARAAAYADGLRLPALPPVDGVVSRGFNAARGHFAVDFAASEGTPVRAVAAGYVVAADWTHDGGHTIAVQHPDGYLSVYKHNARLLKRVGERVRARETLALSGDTGEVTSGPHLHLELWRDGLAQDPAALLLLPDR